MKVEGIVTSVRKYNFSILFRNKNITCSYSDDLTVKIGDHIRCFCVGSKSNYEIIETPVVIVGSDDKTIMTRAFEIKNGPALINEYIRKDDKNLSVSLKELAYNKEPQTELFSLRNWWIFSQYIRQLKLFGITNDETILTRTDPWDLIPITMNDPYRVISISMEKAQKIYFLLGLKTTDDKEAKGRIARFIFNKNLKSKWIGVPYKTVVSYHKKFDDYADELLREYKIKTEFDTVYLGHQLYIEKLVCNQIIKFITGKLDIQTVFDPEEVKKIISPTEEGIVLDEIQFKACCTALNSNISMILGEAGTGKTKSIGDIIKVLDDQNIEFVITSPTGKAAYRVNSELYKTFGSKFQDRVMTLHRFLRKREILTFEFLIIDETSMITTELLCNVLKRYKNNFRLILVGDSNQLLPIESGRFLDNMMKIKSISKVKLLTNYREYINKNDENNTDALLNGITFNARGINNSTPSSKYELIPYSNFEIINHKDENTLDEAVRKKLIKMKKEDLNILDFRILIPYVKDVNIFNPILQEIFNPETKYEDYIPVPPYNKRVSFEVGETVFRIGDIVRMTVNNYDINVMNGTEGVITGFGKVPLIKPNLSSSILSKPKKPEMIEVIFIKFKFMDIEHQFSLNVPKKTFIKTNYETGLQSDEKEPTGTIYDLVLSYALNVHQAQGDEYKIVMFILRHRDYYGDFISKELIYTALTRGKNKDIVFGHISGIENSASNIRKKVHDNLALRIETELENLKNQKQDLQSEEIKVKSKHKFTLPEDKKVIKSKISENTKLQCKFKISTH